MKSKIEYKLVGLLPLTFHFNASEPAIPTSFVGVMFKNLASRLFIQEGPKKKTALPLCLVMTRDIF